ncbi:MAG: N-acetylmuramoyl-L-alanine amidase, partial [Actinobacteria bacterium]|nr:N-acetylmuramoyl-L-alanine amidase [Actinomycetota bacterium]
PGDHGDVVTDVTNTLHRLGFIARASETFSDEVSQAVRAFQQERGLSVTGLIDETTLVAINEARWKLGDRSLKLTSPAMRGDDVASLQSRLMEMGFNPGRVDGIYGSASEAAVKEFQKSVGTKIDGICGPATVIALMRLLRTVTGGAPVQLRDQARREKRGPALADKVIVLDPSSRADIAEFTFDLAQKIEGRLIALGVSVFLTRGLNTSPSEDERIAFANNTSADLLISLSVDRHNSQVANGLATFFYGSEMHGVHSIVGEKFATIVQRELIARTDLLNNRTHAKTWNLLRLTKAPAVMLDIGYISNSKDSARLADPNFRDVIAEGLVVAIQRMYLSAEQDAKTGTLRLEDLRKAGIRK